MLSAIRRRRMDAAMHLEDRILFIDGEAIVIDKPAGLAGRRAARRAATASKARIEELTLGFKRAAGRRCTGSTSDTSGCLLLARNPKARAKLPAGVRGAAGRENLSRGASMARSPGEEGLIDLPLAKISSAEAGWRMVRRRRAARPPRPAGAGSAARRADAGRVPAGDRRTHQIRVHAARGLGAAIVGDPSTATPARRRCCSTPAAGRAARAASRRSTSPRRCPTASADGWISLDEAEDVVIPEDALSEKFLAATGPGGQNVNKVATACQLRVDVFKLGLSPDVYERLKAIAGSRMTDGGELVITARRFRTQEANREDARAGWRK